MVPPGPSGREAVESCGWYGRKLCHVKQWLSTFWSSQSCSAADMQGIRLDHAMTEPFAYPLLLKPPTPMQPISNPCSPGAGADWKPPRSCDGSCAKVPILAVALEARGVGDALPHVHTLSISAAVGVRCALILPLAVGAAPEALAAAPIALAAALEATHESNECCQGTCRCPNSQA